MVRPPLCFAAAPGAPLTRQPRELLFECVAASDGRLLRCELRFNDESYERRPLAVPSEPHSRNILS